MMMRGDWNAVGAKFEGRSRKICSWTIRVEGSASVKLWLDAEAFGSVTFISLAGNATFRFIALDVLHNTLPSSRNQHLCYYNYNKEQRRMTVRVSI